MPQITSISSNSFYRDGTRYRLVHTVNNDWRTGKWHVVPQASVERLIMANISTRRHVYEVAA